MINFLYIPFQASEIVKRGCFVLLMLPLLQQLIPESRQTLVIANIDSRKGSLYIGWYNGAEDFRKADRAVFKRIVAVDGQETASVSFDAVPPGAYAVAVFLDENGNGKIDTNFFGIPKEKYGFSNNVFPMMRAASFSEASFTVTDKDGSIRIRLK